MLTDLREIRLADNLLGPHACFLNANGEMNFAPSNEVPTGAHIVKTSFSFSYTAEFCKKYNLNNTSAEPGKG